MTVQPSSPEEWGDIRRLHRKGTFECWLLESIHSSVFVLAVYILDTINSVWNIIGT